MSWSAELAALATALAPVFLLIALGQVLSRSGLIDQATAVGLARLLYFVGLPVQIVVVVGGADLSRDFDARAVAAATGALVIAGLVAWWLTRRMPPERRGPVINGSSRPNGAFVGLPVILLAAPAFPAAEAARLPGAYVVLLAIMVPLFNVGAVLAFSLVRNHRGGWGAALAEIPRNPIILGCICGLVLAMAEPGALAARSWWADSLHLLAQTSIPLALLVTGAQLDLAALRADWAVLGWASAVKLFGQPLLALGLAAALGCDRVALCVVVVLMACPTAMAAVPMARLMGGDAGLMAALVTTTTVLAAPVLFAWLTLMRYILS